MHCQALNIISKKTITSPERDRVRENCHKEHTLALAVVSKLI